MEEGAATEQASHGKDSEGRGASSSGGRYRPRREKVNEFNQYDVSGRHRYCCLVFHSVSSILFRIGVTASGFRLYCRLLLPGAPKQPVAMTLCELDLSYSPCFALKSQRVY